MNLPQSDKESTDPETLKSRRSLLEDGLNNNHDENSLRNSRVNEFTSNIASQGLDFFADNRPRDQIITPQSFGNVRFVNDEQNRIVNENAWSKLRIPLKEALGEFFGTMILILFGVGSVAQVKLSSNNNGTYQSINFGWALGVILGVVVSSHGSAGHLNPAVTLANCLFRGFSFKKFLYYMPAQILGAFVGAAIVYGNYINAINAFEGGSGIRTTIGPTSTGSIFYTQAQPYLSAASQFFSEFIATALLIIGLFAINDPFNNSLAEKHELFLIFWLIFGIGACFGLETGYAINLARDLGPRLFTYVAGYGHAVWTDQGNYSIIPCTAPFAGAIFGGFLYDMLIYVGESPVNKKLFGIPYWRRRFLGEKSRH